MERHPNEVDIAVYQGEKILCVGTYKECARELDLSPNTLRKMRTPHHLRQVERMEKLRKTKAVTAERKYDLRLKANRGKEQRYKLFNIYGDPIFEGTEEEAMEFTNLSIMGVRNLADPKRVEKAHQRAREGFETMIVIVIEED